MADETATTTTEAPSLQTFKIPVRNAAPEEHEHQGRTFKIPVRGKQFSVSVHQPQSVPKAADNLAKIEENPDREGTYAVKVNGQVKQVPFSKVPHVAAIAPMMAVGSTNFANEADELRYLKDLSAYEENLRSALPKPNHGFNLQPVFTDDELRQVRGVDERIDKEVYSADRWDMQAQAQTAQPTATEQPKPSYEPTWWRWTKKGSSAMYDLFLGGSGPGGMPNIPPALISGTDVDPQVFLQKWAAQGNAQAQQTLGLQKSIQENFGSTLTPVAESAAFQKVFDPKSKNIFSRGVTGFTKSVEGMTSIENIYSLAAIYMAPESISKPMGLVFQADIAKSGVEGIAGASEAAAKGDTGASSEAWGGMLGNIAVIVAMGTGERAIRSGVDVFQNRDTTAILNDKAQEAYKKKFGDLTPNEKASVLYEAVEDANPRFKKRVDQEVAKLNQKRVTPRFFHGVGKDAEGRPLLKKVGIDPRAAKAGAEAAELTTEEVRQQRLEAAKKLIRQIVERKARAEAYKHEATQREAAARKAIDEQQDARHAAERADMIVSAEEQRGFSVTENREDPELLERRTTVKTSEREAGPEQRDEPVPAEPVIPVVDRRAAAAESTPEELTDPKDDARYQRIYGNVARRNPDWSTARIHQEVVDFMPTDWQERHREWNKYGKTLIARASGEPTPEEHAQVTAAERAVQERTEAQFGQLFTSLPVDRQKFAAAWLEKNHPEQWEAFKKTPAYVCHLSDVKHADMIDAAVKQYLERNATGDEQPLAPGADLAAGTAKLILNRSNIDSVLKADPATAHDLNAHTERLLGKSFDSLPAEMRAPALADYLRTKPEKVRSFMTVDLIERMRTGQHIDIANMDAQGMMRQRASLRMDQRDSIRRAMDEDLAARMVTEERDSHHKELAAAITASETGRSPSLDEVNRVRRGLSEQTKNLSAVMLEHTDDPFKLEEVVKKVSESKRTPAMSEFLTRMRQVRAAGENYIARELAEKTAASFRDNPEEARADAVERVARLSIQSSDLQQAADDLHTQGQTAAAEAAQQAADNARQQAEAVVAGAESVVNPAPPPPPGRPRPKLVLGAATEIVTPNHPDGLKAHYVLLPSKAVRTSHHPITFEPTEGYDQKVQKRRYENNKGDQTDITVKGANPDGRILYSDTPGTMEGPPLLAWRMDADGNVTVLEVFGGNGREMIRQRARLLHPDAYQKLLNFRSTRIDRFGLSDAAGQVEFGTEPYDVYRLLDEPVTDEIEWTRLGEESNRDLMKGSSAEEEGVAMARLLTPEYLDRLDDIFSSLPQVEIDKQGKESSISLSTAMRARSADIANLLADAGIIAPNKRSEFIVQDGDKAGDLTPKAKNLIENMLVGLTVSDPKALDGISDNVRNKLARAGIFFVKAKSAGDSWNLASYNSDAVRLITKAQDISYRLSRLIGKPDVVVKGAGSSSLIEKYLYTGNYQDERGFGAEQGDLGLDTFSFVEGQSLGHPETDAVVALAMALEKTPREYALMMAKYADRSKPNMFGAEHPADVFNAEIASKFKNGEGNTLHVIPEEWGSVAPIPDSVKAAIEDGRGPLPVEPEEHQETVIADVQPDSSSVVDALPEGPRTVRELRKALAAHPEISKDIETTEKITQMFEHILPTALGESMESILGNRRLTYIFGGEDPSAPKSGGYFQMLNEAQAMIHLCDTADSSTYLHEMAHHIRRFMKPEYQKIANKFVGAEPGKPWSREQEERFADAFVHYYHDGGIKRGNAEGTKKMEGVFAHISRAMQSIYNSVRTFANGPGNKELDAMFDEWHDWSTAERKPFIKRVDIDAIAEFADKVEIPKEAKVIEKSARPVFGKTQDVVFTDEKLAKAFVKRNAKKIGFYEMLKVKGEETIYIRVGSLSMKLRQPGLNEVIELARKAKSIEDDLKRENNPERRALLRGQLNNIEDKLRGSTSIIGAGKPELKDTSIIQLVHGVSEMPRMDEPTTPAQAVTVQQVHGDPTAVSLGESSPRKTRTGKIAEPSKNPLADVPAASLQAPKKPRGTPVVDPDVWRGYVEALGLPEGTPPPTVRLDPDVREMMIYLGQAEAAEGVLSALQHQDATILAAPAGSGKTWLLSAIAHHLLGDGGEKVGLLVTKSRNLIEDDDGFMDVARKFGIDVDNLPSDMSQLQTGMYATTYTSIRGDKDVLSVPWDFVLFDESAEASNWEEAEQGKAVTLLGHVAKKVVYSSATPYSKIMQIGYMHKLGLWPKGGFTQWAKQFGLVESGPNEYSSRSTPEQLAKLRQQLIERGQWQTLYKDMTGVEARVALVPQTEEVRAGVRSIRAAFAKAGAAFQKAGMSKYITPVKGHEVIYLKRYLTAARLPNVIKLAKDLSAKGWSPIMFTEYRSPAEEGMEFFNELPAGLGAEINKMLPPLPNVVEKMREAFGDKIAIFAGPHNAVRAGELKAFQAGEKDAMYMSFAAGSIGANAQDKIGTKPRAALFIDVPWSPVMLEQGTARPWRYGSKSNVAMYFFTSDSLPEMKTLATKTLPRMRSLKAAVYGEKYESDVSKAFRDAAGIPAEVRDFMQDEEKPDAADFEQDGKGVSYTHIDDVEIPDAAKAKNKGMKYKGKGEKLYQGPKDEDPFERLGSAAWDGLFGELKKLPAPKARAVTANEGVIRLEAEEAGRAAMGTGESVENAVARTMRSRANETQLWIDAIEDKLAIPKYKAKKSASSAAHLVKSTVWMFGTAGDVAVEKIFRNAGMPEEGKEASRRMIEYDQLMGNHIGEFGGMVERALSRNKITAPELELVSKIVEGSATTNNPRIKKAADELAKFFATVHQRCADAGIVVRSYDDGLKIDRPFDSFESDPHYWPRIYEWNEPIKIKGADGKTEVTTLSEILNMPNGSERREKLIDMVAKQRGISKIQAQAFFDRNNRGIRLAGNIERTREFDIPLYGRNRGTLERYVQEVAQTLAAAEVHGQFREKTDALIDKLPTQRDRDMVNHIITSDLDPARLHDSDRWALRRVNQWLILSKMGSSALKLPFHLAKVPLATNTRSLALAIVEGVTNPKELKANAVDSGVMAQYVKQSFMREYGLKTETVDQKLLKWNGFTAILYFSRAISSAAGRIWFEKYAYPELRRVYLENEKLNAGVIDPTTHVTSQKYQAIRRKLGNLYGMSDEHIDNISKNNISAADVRRIEVGSANWTTGSGRPSELAPVLRGTTGDPLYDRLTTILRISQSLHGFMFKTNSFINRTVWHELMRADSDYWKSAEPYKLIARFGIAFGMAGYGLNKLREKMHEWAHSSEAGIEQRRDKWCEENPASSNAIALDLSYLALASGNEEINQMLQIVATHNAKDAGKLVQQRRALSSTSDLIVGVAPRDAYNTGKGLFDYLSTFKDTGPHKESPAERREKIKRQWMNEEVPLSRYVVKPKKVEPSHHARRHKATSRF